MSNNALAVFLVSVAMIGLAYGVEYSGWVLFVGLLVAMS